MAQSLLLEPPVQRCRKPEKHRQQRLPRLRLGRDQLMIRFHTHDRSAKALSMVSDA